MVNSINFFGNHFPIYEAAGIPTIVTSPVTIADFTADTASIGAGGGCLGNHTALVHAATQELEGQAGRRPVGRHPSRASCATTTSRPSPSTC